MLRMAVQTYKELPKKNGANNLACKSSTAINAVLSIIMPIYTSNLCYIHRSYLVLNLKGKYYILIPVNNNLLYLNQIKNYRWIIEW